MDIHVIQIAVIVILGVLAWWVNEKLNPVPILKIVVQVVIVVASVLLLLQSAGLIDTNSSVSIK